MPQSMDGEKSPPARRAYSLRSASPGAGYGAIRDASYRAPIAAFPAA